MTIELINTKLGPMILIASGGFLVYCNWDETECQKKLKKILKEEKNLLRIKRNLSDINLSDIKDKEETTELEKSLARADNRMGEAGYNDNTDKAVLYLAKKELEEYLSGKRKNFTIKIEIKGTDFQKMVWSEILKIPYGEKISYKEIGERLGKPGSVRAIAQACGANPLALVIPCHRVIGSRGKMGGYTGGLGKKLKLINIEKSGKKLIPD